MICCQCWCEVETAEIELSDDECICDDCVEDGLIVKHTAESEG